MNGSLKNSHNIYIVGAQSTGKTTIVNELEATFAESSFPKPQVIKEVARTVLKKHKFTAEDITSSRSRALELQQLILKAQLYVEEQAVLNGRWFISDRSGIDPIVYARKYVSEEAAFDLLKSAEWQKLRERMKNSLVVVCEAGGDWLLDDGVRLMPENQEDWIDFDKLFCRCLDEWDVGYELLPQSMRDIDERVSFVMERWRSRRS